MLSIGTACIPSRAFIPSSQQSQMSLCMLVGCSLLCSRPDNNAKWTLYNYISVEQVYHVYEGQN